MKVLSLGVAALCLCAQVWAQTFEPDHYVAYKVKAVGLASHDISVRDKFIDWTEFRLSIPYMLLNPTIKLHNGNNCDINNKELHYAAYKLEKRNAITVNQPIQVSNQFGQFEINEMTLHHILVPTRSEEVISVADRAKVLDATHYLCYDIPETPIEAEQGTISDEFRIRDFVVTAAKTLCTPAAKVHGNNLYDINDDYDTNHLMCFSLEHKHLLKFRTLANQFGNKSVMITKDSELCVPSTVTTTGDQQP